MPMPALANVFLLFFDDKDVELPTGSVFQMMPWTNSTFRELCGLRPLLSDVGQMDEGDGRECVRAGDGLVLTSESYQALKLCERGLFDEESLRSVTTFLEAVRTRAIQQRAFDSRKARRSKKKGPEGDGEPFDSASTRCNNLPGYNEFKAVSLALLNKPAGLMCQTVEIMERVGRTPAQAWRYRRHLNETIGPRKPVEQLEVPNLTDYNFGDSVVTVPLAEALFGEEAVAFSHIVPVYEPFIKALLHRAWERLGRQTSTALKQANVRREKYKEAWEEADKQPTPGNLRQASRALRDYRDLAKITGEADGREFRELDKRLTDLWAELGYARDKEGRVSKVKAKRNMILSTEEDMRRAYEAYIELHFPTDEDAIAEITYRLEEVSTAPEVALNLVEGVADEDLGVAEFTNLPSQEVLGLLGLAQAKRLPFASDSMEMKWHQLVGVAAMIKAMFTSTLAMPPRPTLLCDDVGLGKTVQIIGIVSMLVHLIEVEQPSKAQTGNTPWPPLITDSGNLFFAGRDNIPRLPVIIAAPRTLIRQWYSQIIRFTTPNAFRVIIYPSEQSERKKFWAKDGVYAEAVEKAKHPHRTIILVATSESSEFLPKLPETRDGKRILFRGDVPGVLTSKDARLTLFGHDYLLFVLDESHNLRNANKSQQGAMTLAARSVVRVGASATPVFTSAKDLAAQGRLLRYEPMIGDDGYDLGMDMLRLERQRAKEWKEGSDELIAGISDKLSGGTIGSITGAEKERDADAQRQMVGEYVANQDSQGYRNYYINQVAIDRLRSLLLPIVIRRTGASRDPNGKTVLNLDPYVESMVWVRLREDESQAIKDLFEEMMSNRDQEGGREIKLLVWKNFLMDHKSVLFHSKLAKSTSNEGSEDFWKTWTADDLPRVASSKIMGVLGVVEHYDDPKASPMYFKRDGTRDLQKEEVHTPNSGNDPSEKPRKILMFIMYEVHREIIKTVLSLRGRRCLVYDGNMSTRIREQVVAQFEKDDGVRIMLISNVGTTGLNLTTASVVIFVSGLWSGLETMQTIGRCWRHGQTRIVHVYHIIVPDTVDEMLCGYANGKLLMWGYFLRRDELVYKLFGPSDRELNTQHDNFGDEVPTSKTKSHARGRALKAAKPLEDCASESGVKAGSKRKAKTSSEKRKKARLDAAAEKDGAEHTASRAEKNTVSREQEALPSPTNEPMLGLPADIDVAAMYISPAQDSSGDLSHAVGRAIPLHAATRNGYSAEPIMATSSFSERLDPLPASTDTQASCSAPSSAAPTTPDGCEDAFMRGLLSEVDRKGKARPPHPACTAESTVAHNAYADLTFDSFVNVESTVDKRDDQTDYQEDVGQVQTSHRKRVEVSGPQQPVKHTATQLQPSPLVKRSIAIKSPVSLKKPSAVPSPPTGTPPFAMSQTNGSWSGSLEVSSSDVNPPSVSAAASPMDKSDFSAGMSNRTHGQFKKNVVRGNRDTGRGKTAVVGAFGRLASGGGVRMRSPPRNAKPATGRIVNLDFSVLSARERQSGTKD
ncbi:hypothetical protein FRC10_007832 [Ceratobasidium sp. 414]|nr:hypothetical protein FRC10_007832 [Ceratobasidium sp. 414]